MEAEPSTEQMIAEFQTAPESEAVSEPALQAAPEPEAQASIREYEYSANGKTIKEPIEIILKRASQGYNYAQHMQELKNQQTEFEQKQQHVLELEKKYGEIDRFAQENPEWNDHLHKTWESRFDITGGQETHTQQQQGLPSQLQQEFNEMRSFVESIKAERADAAYQGAVDKVKQAYPDIDFSQTDPDTGRTLEQQVLDFASENSIGRFEPAFKAFYADKLVERARNEAREQMAGDIKQRSKAGLLGTSRAPTKGQSEMEYPSNYRDMSSDQLHNWIVEKYT